MSTSRLFSLFLIGSLFFTSCTDKSKKSQSKKPDKGFISYVSAYTSGVISNQSTIKIKLANPVLGKHKGDVLEQELFEFSPDIEGHVVWIDNQTIEFSPDVILPSGVEFEAVFNLDKVRKVPDKFKDFEFSFQTIRQAVFVSVDGTRTLSEKDLTKQEITGQLTTTDFADPEKVEQILSSNQSGKNLSIAWEHNSDGRIHNFTIENVTRTEKPGMVVVSWDGAPIEAEETDKLDVEIASLSDFKVMNVQVNNSGSVEIYFSDPINSKQNLEGLIYFTDGYNFDYSVNSNIISIHPKDKLVGDLVLNIESGIENSMGYKLTDAYNTNVKFLSMKPNLALLTEGVIIPSSAAGGLTFPFKAVNLSAVKVRILRVYEDNIPQFLQTNQLDGGSQMKRVGRMVYQGEIVLKSDKAINYSEWNSFSIDLSGLIKTEPGAIYRVQIGFDKKHSLYPCDDDNTDSETFEYEADDKEHKEEFYDEPNSYYYYGDDFYTEYDYDYNSQDIENPCTKSYYANNRHSITRNVLASDIGIIAKGGDDNHLLVTINDLVSANPLANVKVDIYNYQDQLMLSQTTDGKGMIDVQLSNKPFLLVARQGKQRGYLRLDNASSLSMSMFDIGGRKNKKGVKGFIYGERGVWRPGDTLFLNFILEDKNKSLPAKHPVIFELYTPESQLYQRLVKTDNVNGFYNFTTRTDADAPTGNWLAKVKVGGSTFTKTLKIEAIKPNRLKIDLDFKSKILHANAKEKGTIKVTWLHGAVASKLKTKVELTLKRGKTGFEGYPDYVFDDPSRSFYEETIDVFDGILDSDGEAFFDPDIPDQENAPGMLKARFNLRVFEHGGDASIDRRDFLYSPYKTYVGFKMPKGDGWMGALYSDKPNLIPIVTVDENGKPVDREKVRIEIYDVRWSYWWERNSNNGLGQYVANKSKFLIKTDYVNTKNGEAIYELNFNEKLWGRKLIRITDPVSGHTTGQTFYLEYSGYWNSDGVANPGGAEMLAFTTDKKKYKVGETVKVELPRSLNGRAWVSIESGSKVIENYWVDMKKGAQQLTFETTKEMAPNVYVNIFLVQPHNQMVNDLPMRMYGVQPIVVVDDDTRLSPEIKMPDELRPEQNFSIEVSEKQGKPMTYTLAVVDDGLLDLTHFKTPDAWNRFYNREALGVRTWDMYKYVMGALSGEFAGLLALGGDEYMKPSDSKKANRFKPVVSFIGPFELKAGKTNTHHLDMPNYVGSVRVMVVAGYKSAYGLEEKTVKVKKPLMVIATLPRVVGPGETVKLPVTVFAMNEKVKNVEVSVETNQMLAINGAPTKQIRFDRQGDQVVDFELKVPEKIGIGHAKVLVKSGNESATYEIEIDVRLPNPPIHKITDGFVESGDVWNLDFKSIGLKGTNKNVLEVSSIPPINLEARMQYLIQYPHGCIEQTTSSAFPQLFLERLTNLDSKQKTEVNRNVTEALNRIKKFQVSSGGFSYWPGESEVNDWGTNYAGHFMLEARDKGYQLPLGVYQGWLRYQKQRANLWSVQGIERDLQNQAELTQAYRLYTLALAQSPAMAAMNRMRENPNTSRMALWRLAAAYQLAGKPEIAKEIVGKAKQAPQQNLNRWAYAYTYGSSLRDEAMILETYALMGDKSGAKEYLDGVVDKVGSDQWFSTQTTAYSLLAIAEFIGDSQTGDMLKFDYNIDGTGFSSLSSDKTIQTIEISESVGSHSVAIKNTSGAILFTRVYQEGIPLTGDATSESSKLNFEVNYYDMSGNEINPTVLKQGTDFMVVVDVRGDAYKHYKDMSLIQIFPSGWEIRNTRIEGVSTDNISDKPRYQDVRDDRVYTYFDLDRAKSKRFVILLNAAYSGRFYLPTTYCEAMYDNSIYGRVGGKWVVVKGE